MGIRITHALALIAGLLAVLVLAGCGAGATTTHTGRGALAADRDTSSASAAHTIATTTRTRHCYGSPMACGFPDPAAGYPNAAYVGPHNAKHSVSCGSLTPRRGVITVSRAGATLRNVDVSGRIVVTAPNVTLENLCVAWNGQGNNGSPPAVEFEATGGKVIDAEIGGANATDQSVQITLGENVNRGYRLFADHVLLDNCSECVHNDGWHLKNSYVISNGRVCGGYSGGHCVGGLDHVEDVYCNAGSFTANHDTLINPQGPTAVVFCDNTQGGACTDHVTIKNSLLAGGGFTIYGCSNGVPVGTSSMVVAGNRFARCHGRPVYQPSSGGSTCTKADRPSNGKAGLWPYDGYFGWVADSYCPRSGPAQVWSDNVWDDNDHPVPCHQNPDQ